MKIIQTQACKVGAVAGAKLNKVGTSDLPGHVSPNYAMYHQPGSPVNKY